MAVIRHPIVGFTGLQKDDEFMVKLYMSSQVNDNGFREAWSSEWMEGTYTFEKGLSILAANAKLGLLPNHITEAIRGK